METILMLFKSVLEMYAQYLPNWVIGVLLIIGTCRVVIKPALAFAHAVVEVTPSKKDDEALAKVESSKWLKGLQFVLDWVFSLKLPPKK